MGKITWPVALVIVVVLWLGFNAYLAKKITDGQKSSLSIGG
jgi:hypothetical protein